MCLNVGSHFDLDGGPIEGSPSQPIVAPPPQESGATPYLLEEDQPEMGDFDPYEGYTDSAGEFCEAK